MNKDARKAIVISASSDIGLALSNRWLGRGWTVAGTSRTESLGVQALRDAGALLVDCDLSRRSSVEAACETLCVKAAGWDVLVLCPGTQEPVGPFEQCDFDAWEDSLRVNFAAQLRVVHHLLPARSRASAAGPCVLFFAGGGTNSATVNYSAYTVSKIALIKMCELLDAEIRDARFVTVGPGWVRTKIHQATLAARARAGATYEETLQRLGDGRFTSMQDVVASCEWVIEAPRDVVGGRNFSTVNDAFGSPDLDAALRLDANMYKLRRSGNDWTPKLHGSKGSSL